jgi:uncharacterized membrane protein YkvA (DUF1232 family)
MTLTNNPSPLDKLKQRAKALKTQTYALYLAYRHPDTPWYAKLFAGLVTAYAFSPIDLVPDFIPVLGYLDDLVLVPLGVSLALKMIPEAVIAECRAEAEVLMAEGKPVNRAAAAVIVLIWLGLAALVILWIKSL